MSRRSRDRGEPTVKRDPAKYGDNLAVRFRLLSKASADYDEGDQDQTAVIAGHLRVLLAEGMIDRVAATKRMRFTDSAERPESGTVSGGSYGYGITRIRIAPGSDGQNVGSICPPLGNAYREAEPPTANFHEWWLRDMAIYPTNRPPRTREFLVYEMANTDGVHMDDELDADYDALTRDNHGFVFDGVTVTGNLASAAIRQIAWETQHTLSRHLPDICGTEFPDVHFGADDVLWRIAAQP